MEQMRAQRATSSIGAKEAPGLRTRWKQPFQSSFGAIELRESGRPIELAQRSGVRESMITDAVAIRARALGDSSAGGFNNLFAKHKESRLQIVLGETIEYLWRYQGLRSVIERQGNFRH